MRSLSGEETLAAKYAYERIVQSHGVTVRRYHADNVRYGDKAFRDACTVSGQELSFCGYWPEYITTMLWPYTLKAAEDRHSKYAVDDEGVSPEEKFVDI
eukprot:11111513-Ditylum_brightwellii.AAC.1